MSTRELSGKPGQAPTVEYPQKYGQPNSRPVPDYIREAAKRSRARRLFAEGDLVEAYRANPLATDVRYWGHWMLEQAREELEEFYPPDPDGGVPVAYLWSRTVPCPNCHAEMPLIRQYWLARKGKRKVALKPVIDRENRRIDFEVTEGPSVVGDPAIGTATLGDISCLVCNQVLKGIYVRETAKQGRMGAVMTAVVLASSGRDGKRYRPDAPGDQGPYQKATLRLQALKETHGGELPLVPNEPMPVRANMTGGVVSAFGFDEYGKLFNERQLVALTTFARLVGEAHSEMLRERLGAEYSKAVATYLGIMTDRFAAQASTLCRWDATSSGGTGAIMNTFSRQALPMVWDYAEVNPLSGMTGDFRSAIDWVTRYLAGGAPGREGLSAVSTKRDARAPLPPASAIVADPPYYDAINYSDLSDFFYVWLKRSIGFLHRDLLAMPLTPKREQIVMSALRGVAGAEGSASSKDEARQRYVEGMAQAFSSMRRSLAPDGFVGVVFAHTDPDAWGTLIEGLLDSGLIPDTSWPIDTELQSRVSALGQARLKTSVWMACRLRGEVVDEAFLGDLLEEMRQEIRVRLLYFWARGIRGADFFISAIGPALSVYGRHNRVLRPDGTEVTVRDFLDLVRRESTSVALEQVLGGADLGAIDPVTRQYLTWVWSYSRASLDAGEAIALCLATGAEYANVVREGSIAAEAKEKSKKVVRLRTIADRSLNDEQLGQATSARPAPLIDQLQRAASLWGRNGGGELTRYRADLGETRWVALRTLGQAVAECLPDGDEDRRLINGLLGSSVMGAAAPLVAAPAGPRLPGFEDDDDA